MKDIIQIREVGLRDGLQLSKTKLSTETKIKWLKQQFKSGFREIEVTSFVPPTILPQFNDATKIVYEANKHSGNNHPTNYLHVLHVDAHAHLVIVAVILY